MYNLLLVDDEEAVVKGLAYDIEWSELTITGVYKAYSVSQALSLMEQTRIDIVVSDISMPEADGIALAAEIRKRRPAVSIVFLSGHDDFAYAQKAIELGVAHYLTKPVDYEELKDKIRNTVKQLERELFREDALRSAKESLERMRPLLQERALYAWVVKGTESPLAHADKFTSAGLVFKAGDVFIPVVLRAEDDEQTGSTAGADAGVREMALKELAEEWLLRGMESFFFPSEPGQWVLLYRGPDLEEAAKAAKYMEEMAEPFKESAKRTLGCGISVFFGAMSEADGVSGAYRKLDSTVRRTNADAAGVILFADRPSPGAAAYERLEALYETPELSLLLDKLDMTKAMERIDLIFQEIDRREPVDMTALLEIYHVVSGVVIHASLRNGMSLAGWAGDNERMLYPFLSDGKAADLKKWCQSVIQAFMLHLRGMENKRFNRLVEQAKRIVDEQYARDVSVAEIASYLYVHPNYLTRVFKSETGLSLMDYISKRRIEQAKGLLAQPEFKVYEVAERVGYESIAHFNRMFKRETGMSPKEYQKTISKP